MRKLISAIMSLLIIYIIVLIIAKCCSYHEPVNYSNIERIQYNQYLGEFKYIEYIDDKEIKKISRKIQHLNLYPAQMNSLQESPTASINIVYSDDSKKSFNIAGAMVLITETRNNKKIKRDKYFYYVNPIKLKMIFR